MPYLTEWSETIWNDCGDMAGPLNVMQSTSISARHHLNGAELHSVAKGQHAVNFSPQQ